MLEFITQITLKGVYNARFQIEVIKHENCLQYDNIRVSLVALMVKNPPALRKTWVPSLGWEDPLEKGMQPTPVSWPGESHGRRSLVDYSPWGHRVGHD